MKCKVKFANTATNDLFDIAFYLLDISGDRDLAMRFVNDLKQKCRILEDFPEIGALPRDDILLSAGLRFLVHKKYLIFYRFDRPLKTVFVLAVFNAKRDYTSVMRRFVAFTDDTE